MNQMLRGVARAASEAFHLPDPLLELGSHQVDDQSELINLRSLFPNRTYTGVDFRPGPGVDCVANAEALPQADASIGTMLAFSTFEHVQRFWVAFDEAARVLRPDGVFVLAVPFYFNIHAYPSDYWRFTPEALDFLLQRFPMRILGWHGAERRPANVWAVAFREEARFPSVAQVERYRQLLGQYAREPLPWIRQVRYRIGRVIAGRRPFAHHLDRERWKIEIRGRQPE